MNLKESYEGICEECRKDSAEVWVGKNSSYYCSDCVFGIYTVEYERYIENIVETRVKSRTRAREKGTSKELLGHCARNAAVLLNELENDHQVPNHLINLCVGSAYHRKAGESTHYWVCLCSDATEIHLDAEVYKDNGGIWVSTDTPSNYSIDRKINLKNSYDFPRKVSEWYTN